MLKCSMWKRSTTSPLLKIWLCEYANVPAGYTMSLLHCQVHSHYLCNGGFRFLPWILVQDFKTICDVTNHVVDPPLKIRFSVSTEKIYTFSPEFENSPRVSSTSIILHSKARLYEQEEKTHSCETSSFLDVWMLLFVFYIVEYLWMLQCWWDKTSNLKMPQWACVIGFFHIDSPRKSFWD